MGIRIRTKMTITEKFRDVLKRQQYETLVLNVLNKSEKLMINTPLKQIQHQSNGEADFEDTLGNKYDVKLLIDKKQGAYIGERKNNLVQWIKSMKNESIEFSGFISSRGEYDLTTTKLYKIVKDRVESLRDDEIGILFCPYPIVHDDKDSYFLRGVTDFLQAVYDKIVEEKALNCKGIYFIYPSMKKGILCLRDGKTREREYIEFPEIDEYISYDTVGVVVE